MGKKQNIFAVVGGDFRSTVTANRLAESGAEVLVFGFDESNLFDKRVVFCENFEETLRKAEVIVLPLPCSATDGKRIHSPLYGGTISFEELFRCLNKDCFVVGGMLPETLKHRLEEKNIPYADYFEREEFAVKNAIPTAEGAIEIAMRETPFTLHGASCLVTGYGRIAKLLAQGLRGLGANVKVCARKVADLALAEANGCEPIAMNRLKTQLHNAEVIFNTVPYPIFKEELLRCVEKDCLLIDLASKPGGVDFEAAQNLGLNLIWALSLPGKCAPLTAGSIVSETILNIIREREEEECS